MLPFARFDPTIGAMLREPIAVGPAEVHVWAFTLDESQTIVEAWGRLLSDDERLRAARFVRERDRAHWIVAHGVLRQLLGRYCGTDPGAIVFEHGAAGKPSIARRGVSDERTTFNLAHSRGRALLAVAHGQEIGVDLERIREDFDPLPIARQFFFGTELTAIQAAAPHLRRDAFFRHWVAKEAVLKAQGVGLSQPLDSFWVTFESDDSIARVGLRDPKMPDPAWLVRMLSLDAGWQGAVAAAGDAWALRLAPGGATR
jgi:4'-phosphopantetheinyl transferase